MLHTQAAHTTRNLYLGLYSLLLLILVVSTFWPQQAEYASVSLILTIKLLPIVIFAPGLLRGNNRSYIWLSFVLTAYFTQGVVSAWITEGALLPTALALVTALMFALGMVHLKVNRPEPTSPEVTATAE
ncbi:MAG: DUF2069 domain-containing protein [Marinobacter sp.]|nr:DUF2069 domain-containing protein [Marinobacter sp.]